MLPPIEEFFDEIKDLWESKVLTNMGKKHNLFEKKLVEYLKTPFVSLFANGHLSLECALEVLKLKGEIITTPYTFISTSNSIVRSGSKPIFCDIDRNTFNIDTTKIEELITPNTCAIMPVHTYGNICNVDHIQEIAEKNHIKVVYDAAHAFGETYKGIPVGNFGDLSIFSFHATKVFNTIEGGAISFSDEKLKKPFRDVKNFGITGPETADYIGGNAKLNEFQASMGLCNLRYISREIQKRKKLSDYYRSLLKDIEGIFLNPLEPEVESNYSYFPIVFKDYKKSRDQVFNDFEKNNIFTRKYFYPLTKNYRCYQEYRTHSTPVAEEISKNVITLPLHSDLTYEDIDRICNILK